MTMKAKLYSTSIAILIFFCLQSFAQNSGSLYVQRGVNSYQQQIIKVSPLTGQHDTIITLNGFLGGTTALTLDKINNKAYFFGFDANSSQSRIYTVDLNTGALVANPACDENYSLGDPQFNAADGKLYAQHGVSFQTQQIIRIDPASGQFDTVITLTGFLGGTTALTLDVLNNRAYFIGSDSFSQSRIYCVDLQAGTLLSNTLSGAQYNVGDPEFNPLNGKLYVQAGLSTQVQQLLSIDPVSGTADTIITLSGFMGGTTALTLDPINNKAYFFGWDSTFNSRIYQVNILQGTLTGNPISGGQYNVGDPAFYLDDPVQEEINPPAGINNTLMANSFAIFPNPATDLVTLKNYNPLCLDKEFVFTLMDVLGNKISVTRFSRSLTFDISDQLKGVYLYHISDGGGLFVNGRLVKE
jgi:hypothetical protein